MDVILIKILPVILIFLLGYVLKILKVLSLKEGDMLIKVIFNFSLPALILHSISSLALTLELMYLPLCSLIVIIIAYFISLLSGKALKLKKTTLGTFIIGAMILNSGFLIPFIMSAFGEDGLARLLLFDFTNGILVFTFIYYQAVKYGGTNGEHKTLTKKFLRSAPLWALLIAMLLNLSHTSFPIPIKSFLKISGDMTIPLMMLSLGIFFNPKLHKAKLVAVGIFIRMGIGLGLGILLSYLFNLDGLNRIIVIIGSAAPIGFNTLTFASLEDLDKEFAASLVSASILIGILYTPLLIYLFNIS
ncbi:MAG: AEC family transporter [Bacteroidetes bacterium]|nr:AEC family transporter [Bacteroidota bacterium]MBT5527722.1 AEC family transporter [Cytophagia bacterium]MBT3800163.1 AEC family transporter [Bacteroidota bacterium]MBT4726936.1 AEC family transporter [Bacteroidota bacterium]MBT4969973.1 AEC family transporter [Bacteroidota bacterium]